MKKAPTTHFLVQADKMRGNYVPCQPNIKEYAKTNLIYSVNWEEVTCKVCLKMRKKLDE